MLTTPKTPLQSVRALCGLSLASLSERCGIPNSTCSAIELGKTSVLWLAPDQLFAYANALSLSVNDLLDLLRPDSSSSEPDLTPGQSSGLEEISECIFYFPDYRCYEVRIGRYHGRFFTYSEAVSYRDKSRIQRASIDRARIGDALRAARERAGLTPAQVVSALHISCGSYSKWERNLAPTPKRYIPLLATLLDVPIEQLTGGAPLYPLDSSSSCDVLDAPLKSAAPVSRPTLTAPSRFQPTIVPAKDNKE